MILLPGAHNARSGISFKQQKAGNKIASLAFQGVKFAKTHLITVNNASKGSP